MPVKNNQPFAGYFLKNKCKKVLGFVCKLKVETKSKS